MKSIKSKIFLPVEIANQISSIAVENKQNTGLLSKIGTYLENIKTDLKKIDEIIVNAGKDIKNANKEMEKIKKIENINQTIMN